MKLRDKQFRGGKIDQPSPGESSPEGWVVDDGGSDVTGINNPWEQQSWVGTDPQAPTQLSIVV
jgi:hypothetical protein